MFDLLVKNGKLVTSKRVYPATVAVREGKVAAILSPEEEVEGKEILDATRRYVFPGPIDTHAHLNDPGYNWREDFAHGTAAAAVGGYTTIIDMPLQNEPAMTNAEILEKKLKRISPQAYVDFCLWGGLIDSNFDDLQGLDEKGCVAFKSFLGPVSPDYVTLNIGQAKEAIEILSSFGARAGFHCEDFAIIKHEEARQKRKASNDWQDFLHSRPVIAEYIATQNVIDIAREVGGKVHICHVSHPHVADLIRKAQQEGVDVTAETCGHYLTFTEADVLQNGSLFKCAPPLRDKDAVEGLWKHVVLGTFSGIASDHSPCTLEEKSELEHGVFGAWGGLSSIQTTVQVTISEGFTKRKIPLPTLAKAMAEAPARAFGIYGRKGALEVGFDADMILIDSDKKWKVTADTLRYVNQISAFVGLEGKGMPVCTIVRGKVIAQDGKILAPLGYGTYISKQKT